ncbi:MAG: helix-turn-helix transcriptional regulator [Lachnospiraceae bacterium]|nr:helix-turn-helix transcriptional regulator [Lachnospiraceae bacterium]
MSVLSKSLENFIRQKKLSIADLAKRCQIDRSTMYQYVHGKRSLQNRELLENILAELRLTPEERFRVMESFEITQIGEERYYRRQKIKEIFESLLTLEENSPKTLPKQQEVTGYVQAIQAISQISGSRLISGELKVQKVIKCIIKDAAERGSRICLFLQPENYFAHAMSVVYEYPENCRITHIICLNANPDPMECDNLEIIKRVIRSGIAIRDYQPFYYYGNPSEHYGMMNMMPYFIMVDDCAMQIAIDGKAVILHKDKEVNQYFQETFGKMLRRCHPLMKSTLGLEKRVAWGMDELKRTHYNNTIEMSSGLCSLQFWNPELIKKYLPPAIPDYENLLKGIAHYASGLYQAKKKGQIKILMNPCFVLAFIKTGVIKEYPSIYFQAPLVPEDRKYILKQIFQAMEEGWYHIYFMEESIFPLDYRWEAVVQPHKSLYMQYCIDDQFRIFEFEIPEAVDAVSDYLESLIQSDSVMDEDTSRGLMRRWIEEYL